MFRKKRKRSKKKWQTKLLHAKTVALILCSQRQSRISTAKRALKTSRSAVRTAARQENATEGATVVPVPCIPPYVPNVEKTQKYLSNPAITDRYTAEIATDPEIAKTDVLRLKEPSPAEVLFFIFKE